MPDLQRLRELLDSHHDWPGRYTFKFVVPSQNVAAVEALFPDDQPSHRPSKNGRYIAVTVVKVVASADEVLAVYEAAAKIEGMLAL